MKAFFVAQALFLLLLGGIVWNFFFLNGTADEINRQVAALPASEDAKEPLDALSDYWEKRYALAGLSVSYEVLYEVDKGLGDLRAAAASGDAVEYERARTQVYLAIRQLRRLEQFSMENIF